MNGDEPTIVFLFDLKNWFDNISVISKLDLIDIIPYLSSQFYYNDNIKAYILIIVKSSWDKLEDKLKYKFSILSRRIKEEMEGPMSNLLKEKYENTDLFELLMTEAAAQQVKTNDDVSQQINIEEDTSSTPSQQ
jgi:hypothetical protein